MTLLDNTITGRTNSSHCGPHEIYSSYHGFAYKDTDSLEGLRNLSFRRTFVGVPSIPVDVLSGLAEGQPWFLFDQWLSVAHTQRPEVEICLAVFWQVEHHCDGLL